MKKKMIGISKEEDHDDNDVEAHDVNDDNDSWVDVRKQRILIIIPALPKSLSKRRVRNRKTLSLSNPNSRIRVPNGGNNGTISLRNSINSRIRARNNGNEKPVSPINPKMSGRGIGTEDLISLADTNSKFQGRKIVNQETLDIANPNSRIRGQSSKNPMNLGKQEILNPANLMNLGKESQKTCNSKPLNIINSNSRRWGRKSKDNTVLNSTFSRDKKVVNDGRVLSKHTKEEDGKSGNDAIATIDGKNGISSNKRKWKCGISRFSTESKRKRTMFSDQPISSMDILLASALDAEHANSVSWQEKEEEEEKEKEAHYNGLLVKSIEEEISVNTLDNGIQPKDCSHPQSSAIGINDAAKTGKISLGVTKGHIFDEHFTSQEAHVHVDSVEKRCIQIPPILTANQAFRVAMLKKHLDKVGGFGKWLCLVGLDQFKEAFEKRTWSEVELLQLNMDDLKHMGKRAVGPRRKLIWAINHLSQQLI